MANKNPQAKRQMKKRVLGDASNHSVAADAQSLQTELFICMHACSYKLMQLCLFLICYDLFTDFFVN